MGDQRNHGRMVLHGSKGGIGWQKTVGEVLQYDLVDIVTS
jgi:hypothetical protein